MCYYTIRELACVSCLMFLRLEPSSCLSESIPLCDLHSCNHTLEPLITVKADAIVKFPLILNVLRLAEMMQCPYVKCITSVCL